ncbi:MAG: T9SS type A sorting domain-containing protein [Candidatus Hatepunaea meridiana]|nr:T9SS type A sorting domain-containing protein [Candidatus Hatepunaea meridiana]
MNKHTITILLTLLFPLIAIAYDLPEVIGVVEAGRNSMTDFCCVSDANLDGKDDLLIRNYDSARVELYYGAEHIEDEFDIAFTYNGGLEGNPIRFGRTLMHLGRILPNRNTFFTIPAYLWGRREERDYDCQLSLYESNENLDNDPEMLLMSRNGDGFLVGSGHNTRQADINGDGFHDIISSKRDDTTHKLQVFFGGENFDTIPDWEVSYRTPFQPSDYSSGYDVNGDGYDDILYRSMESREGAPRWKYYYYLYIGGEEMDTIPVFEFREDHFEGRYTQKIMQFGFSMLSDVNDDGYDDWGIYWTERYERFEDDGFSIFFGSEEPDMEPDLELEGHRRLWRDVGDIAGGDFNGDGKGDIVTVMTASPAYMGEIMIHFGSRWIDGEADIYIDSEREYDGEYFRFWKYLGAVGDYNGDRIDDFVIRIFKRDSSKPFVIFAGNEDWVVDVDTDISPDDYSLSLKAYPNPFNDKVTISYDIKNSGDVLLGIYDIKGRLIGNLENRYVIKGSHRLTWESHSAGIYFIVLDSENVRRVKKVVCVK